MTDDQSLTDTPVNALPPRLHPDIPVLTEILAVAPDGRTTGTATANLYEAFRPLQGKSLHVSWAATSTSAIPSVRVSLSGMGHSPRLFASTSRARPSSNGPSATVKLVTATFLFTASSWSISPSYGLLKRRNVRTNQWANVSLLRLPRQRCVYRPILANDRCYIGQSTQYIQQTTRHAHCHTHHKDQKCKRQCHLFRYVKLT